MSVRRNEADLSWSELAQGDPLAAVLDPADTRGVKNRTIDAVHKVALRRAAKRVRGRAVLDFGCGTGRLSEWLVRHGGRVWGVDATPEMVEVARRRVPSARFEATHGSTVPFRDESFDLVVCGYVLQYYIDDFSVVSELVRVLRPGGRLIAIEQVVNGELGRGGSVRAYEQMFTSANLRLVMARPIRLGDSRILNLVERMPLLLHTPGLARLLGWEARLPGGALTESHYADFAFVTTKPYMTDTHH